MITDYVKIAVIGGGITGSSLASTLAKLSTTNDHDDSTPSTTTTTTTPTMMIHIFDQGRSGVGGRTSHRITKDHDSSSSSSSVFRWDHGCQFFRADTPQFQQVNGEWMDKGFTKEWKGEFGGDGDFFGFPNQPPFYTAASGGIKSICKSLLSEYEDCITLHEGQRVIDMEQSSSSSSSGKPKWTLFGTGGEAAYHDTDEKVAQAAQPQVIGSDFDAVVLTDLSSSFGSWHRASASVPTEFSGRVRDKAGARVPLFTCLIAFETNVNAGLDAFSVENDDTLWFAARTKSKPGLDDSNVQHDCWTLVSTPEYGMREIEETPMQDPVTGAFIPQSAYYLTTVPAPALETAFRKVLESGKLGKATTAPPTVFLGAQRWGSALPAHRHLDEQSETRKVISGVAYDHSSASTRHGSRGNSSKRRRRVQEAGRSRTRNLFG